MIAVFQADETPSRTLVAINMDAEDAVLADVDSYANWLSWQCGNTKPERIVYIPRSDESMARWIESLTVPQLVAVTLCGVPRAVLPAQMALRDRYLADLQTVAYIQRMAVEMQGANE